LVNPKCPELGLLVETSFRDDVTVDLPKIAPSALLKSNVGTANTRLAVTNDRILFIVLHSRNGTICVCFVEAGFGCGCVIHLWGDGSMLKRAGKPWETSYHKTRARGTFVGLNEGIF
jgi:hypothetical protein